MKDETVFLNREQTVDFLNACIRHGKMAEAPGLLMCRIGEELAHLCNHFYQDVQPPTESVLGRYENLSPDDAQLHRALQRLLALPDTDGSHSCLFHSPRHWLSVYKVFQFLHLADDKYGCIARMAKRIACIYGDCPPVVACRPDDMTKKNSGRPFNAPLRVWEQKRRETGMESYWQIALHLLQFLHEECVTVCVTSAECPK